MAGQYRDRMGFANPDTGDGIIQQWDRFAHAIGVTRATEMSGAEAAQILPGRNSDAIRSLMENAFERLSDQGTLRLEGQLGELRTILSEGMALGSNPIEISREMAGRFDSYEGWEFERLARTEVAFSQNAGLMDEFNAEGINMSLVEGDVPPWHPNCMCSISIEETTNDQGTTEWVAVYDISDQACDLCLSYVGR
jgi:hypothetical protein